jgi:threonylcarbamoyladenosine tRNA methylthiotransferase MtaB
MNALQDKTYQIKTLGCKLNQFDSAVIQGELHRRDFHSCLSIREASLVIVNTCTVTAKADAQSRQIIRRIRRENPRCKIIVTGCYARRSSETLKQIPGVHAVIDGSDEEVINDLNDILEIPKKAYFFAPYYNGRTRALLKVQDGCDFECSYCIIPQVRGKSRSVPPDIILKQIEQLISRGYQEIVLTGVNTGDYGKDLNPPTTLLEFLSKIVILEGLGRIRLNSLEPPTITEELIDFLSGTEKMARHLHIPLQSGSNRVLARMNRSYGVPRLSKMFETLQNKIPDIGIGADVIVGFPGETDEDFQDTYRFIQEAPVHFLHVFPFSKRPNTPASTLGDEIHGKVIKERASLLRQLADERGFAFRKRFRGKILEAIILNEKRPDGLYRSLTSNYIHMGVRAEERDIKTIQGVKVTKVTRQDTLGEIHAR